MEDKLNSKLNNELTLSKSELETSDKCLEKRIVDAFEQISALLRRLRWEKAASLGLSPIEIKVLVFVEQNYPQLATLNSLEKEFNFTKLSISGAVEKLQEKGLLERLPNSLDANSDSLSLTFEGEKAIRESESYPGGFEAIISDFPDFEKENLWDTLTEIISRANREGLNSVQKMCFNCKFYDQLGVSSFCHMLNKTFESPGIMLDCPEFVEANNVRILN